MIVRGYYQRFLHRTPDPAGLSLFAGALQEGSPDEQCIAAIVGSDEYFARL